MPFINSRVSVSMSQGQKESLKEKLGQAISLIPGKTEDWLMIEFADNCELYFQGTGDQPAAFLEVKVFGGFSDEAANKMTAAICGLYEEELQIKKDRIYVKYEEVSKWGWNGKNF
ncbi:MAG: hypothetical protein HFH50_16640 [Lachnospiraceae bacterium]|jgi:phenylpyruvate tautomerase PptA (4-oxalocrotonate tautomerase family)|nr:hypothetical protein [Lachnospiraceae bacterium]